MKIRLHVIIFIVLSLLNIGAGIYLWGLWQELKQAKEEAALRGLVNSGKKLDKRYSLLYNLNSKEAKLCIHQEVKRHPS